jgi:hypothetical protein
MPAIRRALAAAVLATAFVAMPGAAPAGAAPCPNEATAGTLLDAPTFERAVICVVTDTGPTTSDARCDATGS